MLYMTTAGFVALIWPSFDTSTLSKSITSKQFCVHDNSFFVFYVMLVFVFQRIIGDNRVRRIGENPNNCVKLPVWNYSVFKYKYLTYYVCDNVYPCVYN